jgi:M6 family metalloprotease-like protein
VALVFIPGCWTLAEIQSDLASRIIQLNRQIEAQLASRIPLPDTAVQGRLTKVLEARSALVEELIKAQPGSIRSVMLDKQAAARIQAAAPEVARFIETEGEWSGKLGELVADDFVNRRSVTHWVLHRKDGFTELFFAEARDLRPFAKRQVRVSGVGTPRVIAVERLDVQMAAIEAAADATPVACSTMGPQNVAVLIVNMPGGPQFPAGLDQPSFWEQQFFSSTPKSVNTYWGETSYGQTSATGQVFGPFALDQSYTCDQVQGIYTSAINAAKPTVDFSSYTRVVVVYPVTTCGWGGWGMLGCWEGDAQIAHPYSLVWIPIVPGNTTGEDFTGLLGHELGHNLGLNHSSTLNFRSMPLGPLDYTPITSGSVGSPTQPLDEEYGDWFTVMGVGFWLDGQYTAHNKAVVLGWLGGSDFVEVTSSGTFTIAPFEQSSGVRALRILRDPLTSSWVWIEYRQPIGAYDGDWLSLAPGINIYQGALVHYEDQYSIDGHLFLLDFNFQGDEWGFQSPDMTPGQTWSDPYSPLTLTVIGATSDGLTVSASYDQTCATLHLSSSVFPATASSETITVTAPSSCSWQASTAASWITFTGATSGQGNGTVDFAVAANPNATQRNGYITIQRQSVAVAQQGTGIFVGAVTPPFGSGSSGNFTLTLNIPTGVSDFNFASFFLQGVENCQIFISPGTLSTPPASPYMLYLVSDSGGSLGPLGIGTSGTLSNSVCSLFGAGSSYSVSGDQLQFTLSIAFTQAFPGAHRIVASAYALSPSSPSSYVPLGTWVVKATPSIVYITPAIAPQGATVPVTIVGNLTHFSSSSSIALSGIGITATNIVATSNSQLTASLVIAADAPTGDRTLSVTTGSETVATTLTVTPPAPSVSLSTTSVSFGNQPVGTTSAASAVTVANNGTGSLTFTGIAVTGDFAVAASGTTCSTSAPVTASSNCVISVTFTPTATGSRSGSLTLTDNASGSPQVVGLSGTGTAPSVNLSTTSVSFGNQPVGTTSAASAVTLTNSGTASLTFTGIAVTGDFAIAASGTTCGTSAPVAASANCVINVTFTPTATGPLTGTLTITDNSNGVAGSTQSVALSGTGQDFSFAPPSGSSTSATVAPGQSATYTLSVAGQGGFNQSVSLTCTGAPSEATCTVPNLVTVGSSATNVTVTVTTTAPSVSAPRSRPLPPVPPLSPALRGLLMLALVLAAMAWAAGRRNQPGVSRWQSRMALLASGLLLTLALAGCGGGGGSASVTHNPGTPAGTYTLTVTGSTGSGSATLSHSVTLTLTVN